MTRVELAHGGSDLAGTVSVVHAAGGTDVSVSQRGHGRIELSVDVPDRAAAFEAAHRLLAACTTAMPLVVGGWILASISGM